MKTNRISVIVSVFVSELLDSSLGIENVRRRITTEERMAIRAKIDLYVLFGRIKLVLLATGTLYGYEFQLRLD